MVDPSEPNLPSSYAELNRPSGRSPVLLSDLGDKLGVSASHWGTGHISAFRFIKRVDGWHKPFLPSLLQQHEQSCPICCQNEHSSQRIDINMRDHIFAHVSQLHIRSESNLHNLPDGRLRLALARLIRSDFQDIPRLYPTRERQSVTRPNYVDSSTMHLPESSSPARPSSSEYSGSRASVRLDDDENEGRANKPEPLVAAVSMELFSIFLYAVLIQPEEGLEYCVRLQSHVSTALIGGTIMVAADDGGVSRQRLQSSSWIMDHPSIFQGENKRASQRLCLNDRTGRYTPVLSIMALAQVFGQAVITWKHYMDRNMDLFNHGVYSYICNGAFIRFFHFEFGEKYFNYVDASAKSEQLRIVEENPEDTCVYVSSSRWFDLEQSSDVKAALCHTLARLRVADDTSPADAMETCSESDSSSID